MATWVYLQSDAFRDGTVDSSGLFSMESREDGREKRGILPYSRNYDTSNGRNCFSLARQRDSRSIGDIRRGQISACFCGKGETKRKQARASLCSWSLDVASLPSAGKGG
jgi:hypothetical protein